MNTPKVTHHTQIIKELFGNHKNYLYLCNMKTIEVDGIIVNYDLESLANEVNNIQYEIENFIDNHRTSGGKGELHEDAPTEEEFINLRTQFANEILNIEERLPELISENLFLTKKGIPAKGRRRPILMAHNDFYVNVIDEYDHDLQFDRPYLKLDMIGDKEGRLIIHEMQTNY
jgi:hypothetical protein